MRDRSAPPADAPELDWLIYEQAGVLTYRQAVACLTPGKVRGTVASGRWRALARGLLLAGNGDLTEEQQRWAAVLVAGRDAVLAGHTAAAVSGVRGLPREPIHVLVPAGRHRACTLPKLPPDMPPVMVRRTSYLPRDHLQIGRPWRTSLPRAVVDAAAWARTDDEARSIIASACQQRRVSPKELREAVNALPRLPRRALTLETIFDVAGGAESLAEINLVKLCRRFGLPAPDQQQRRRDAAGRLRFLDAYWRAWRLHVEVDGAHHLQVQHWEADMQRQNDVWISGDRILRFSSYQVRRRPGEVANQIRRALLAAGWRP